MPAFVFLIMSVALIGCYMWYMKSYDSLMPPIVVGVVVLVIGTGILMYDYTKTEARTVLVEGKDRGGDDGSYRVYTDGDTLGVADIWFSLGNRRTNSADMFGDIQACHRYEILVRGWEFGMLSLMPNIDTIVEDLGPVENCTPTT